MSTVTRTFPCMGGWFEGAKKINCPEKWTAEMRDIPSADIRGYILIRHTCEKCGGESTTCDPFASDPFDALSQIKRAMPQLKQLLGEYDIIAQGVTRGTANQLTLVALVDATVDLIDETLPEGYGNE